MKHSSLLAAVEATKTTSHDKAPSIVGLSRLRGGAEGDSMLESLTSLKNMLSSLEGKLKEPQSSTTTGAPESSEPVVADPQLGDYVRVRHGVTPRFDWGDATPSSVGRLVWFHEDRCTVDFPAHANWAGLLSELERVDEPAAQRMPPRIGDRVRVRPEVDDPKYGWKISAVDSSDDTPSACTFNHSSVGELTGLFVERVSGQPAREVCEVNFGGPDSEPSRLLLSEVERLTSSTAAEDAAAAGLSSARHSPRASMPMPSGREAGPSRPDASAMRAADLAAAFSASSASPLSGDAPPSLRSPRTRPSSSVPFGTWLGWTLGATIAQMPPTGGRRQRRRGDVNTAANSGGDGAPGASTSDSRRGEQPPKGAHSDEGNANRIAAAARGGGTAVLVRALVSMVGWLSPLTLLMCVVGVLLTAIGIILDRPVTSLIDSALAVLPTLVNTAHGVPGPAPGIQLHPLLRSALIMPVRMPAVVGAMLFLYLVCVPGFDLLVRTKRAFEHGYRASVRATTLNTAGADAESEASRDARLHTIIGGWNKLLALLQVARLAALSIGALAVAERVLAPAMMIPMAAHAAPTTAAAAPPTGAKSPAPTTSTTSAA